MKKLKPLNGSIVIKPLQKEEDTIGNIIIPDMGHEMPEIGEVIAVSPAYNWHKSEWVDNPVNVGDTVLVPKMGAQKVKLENEDYWVMEGNNVIAILEEE